MSEGTQPDFCSHEDGEVSRHLSSGDQAAASGRIKQRTKSPAFFGDEYF